MSSSSGTSSGPPPNYSGPPPNYSDKDYIPLDDSVAADNSFNDNEYPKPSSITELSSSTVENIIATVGNDNVEKKVFDDWDYGNQVKDAFEEEHQLPLSGGQVEQILSAAEKVEPPKYKK